MCSISATAEPPRPSSPGDGAEAGQDARETPPLPILYADAHLTVCVKPAGLSSETDLPALLARQTGAPAMCVHRLDTAAGGVMVYARSPRSAAALSRAFAAREADKRYLAVCAGTPEPEAGVFRDLLFRDARHNKSFVVSRPRKGVREASLRYRVLETAGDASLAAVRLETGRSHQIRVQFASRKHPLLGDGKYGSRVRCGLALWSAFLCLAHPLTGEALRLFCPPPEVYPWTLFSPPAVFARCAARDAFGGEGGAE